MNDPELELKRHYAALENPPTAELEARVMRSVMAVPARPSSGRVMAAIAATVVVAAAVGWAAWPPPGKPVPVKDPVIKVQEPPKEGIAARINGEILTWKDVEAHLVGVKPSEMTEALRQSTLRQLAENILFRQFAERKGQTVTEQELDETMRRDIDSYGGQEEFDRMVRIRYQAITKYREDRKMQLYVYKAARYAFDAKASDPELKELDFALEVPEADLHKYYEANPDQFKAIERISFLRVGVEFLNPGQKEEKRALLESVRRKIEAGTEFAMAAWFYSDLQRAKNFRDRNVSRQDLEGLYDPETIRYLFEVLKQGEVSPIVESYRTLNIFKMEQKINQKAETFEEARGKIHDMIQNQLRETNRKRLRDFFRSRAKLEPADLFEEK